MDFRETRCVERRWLELIQDNVQRRAFVTSLWSVHVPLPRANCFWLQTIHPLWLLSLVYIYIDKKGAY
jgi:hypothetical protein